ncbi:MAG: UDP-glucose/GDP-mannose dehydrogenase family protein, partial [Planctomycetes bacterium]|nr:UDP-glucose/GDP-mannose dehydrogenase family protein [Planctomycetota bacterium]
NRAQPARMLGLLELHFDSLAGRLVAVLGVAFKPDTDDVREAPALELVRHLVAAGAQVRVNDPKAMHEARRSLGDLAGVTWCEEPYDATEGADLLCLMTEWRPYRRPDFARLAAQLKARVVFDGRNQYDDVRCRAYGLTVYPIGVRVA